jgi:hypothetical protein
MSLYSYILAKDYGLAPNPFWGKMTLSVCKPGIRKHAHINDWVIGTGVKNLNRANKSYIDFSGKLVFAMKVTQIVTMKEYDTICTTSKTDFINKIPKMDKDWRRMVGDCIYKYPIHGSNPIMRPGLHCSDDLKKDLSGENVLLSDHFYYFGEKAIMMPKEFDVLLKHEQGYSKCENARLIVAFEKWIEGLGYEKNSIVGGPQLSSEITIVFNKDPYNIPTTNIYRIT